MRNGDSDKESHVILAQCLNDQDWMELVSDRPLSTLDPHDSSTLSPLSPFADV